MKTTLTTSFLFISIFISTFLVFNSEPARASHAAGGEITYTHLQGNCYNIRLTFFRDCIGIAIVQPIIVNISSASCAQSATLQLVPLPGTGLEITHPCQGHSTTCTGGNEPGIQKWEFEAQYCFPGQCSDWIINIALAARNSAITTIQNPGGDDIYIEARLNNLNGDNSSPRFSIDPNFIFCVGQGVILNNGVYDLDGDSLVYYLIPARTAQNLNVIYNVPYTGNQPMSSNPAITYDSYSGDLFIHPTAAEVGVIVFQVDEYRNGDLIGSVMRDVNVYTIPCTNQEPTITGINGTSLNSIYVMAEQSCCFNIFCYDGDSNDSLTMLSNNGIIGSTFTIQGGLRPTGVFCWTPTQTDVSTQPHVFTITVLDQSCPDQGISVEYFTIYVTTDSSLVTPLYSHGYITGQVYYDVNSNGVKDSLDMNLSSQRISVQPDNFSVFSNQLGEFLFYTQTDGAHNVALIPPDEWTVTSDSASYNITDASVNQTGFDFGINALFPLNGLDVNIGAPIPRCNMIRTYYLTYENTGSTILNGRVIFIIDSAVSFSSSFPAPDQNFGDSLIYNFTNLWPSTSHTILIHLLLPGAGNTIHFEALAQYDSSSTFITSGTQTLQQIVTCSYDPNDKLVLPEGLYADHRTLYPEELQYTIRFQNTGTDTAFTVFIHDFIDPSLDLSTLHVCGNSHPVNTTIFSNRMVEFKFVNIQLPDSNVDEPESHGFVQYKISPRPNLLLPVVVNNNANIFFDSNFPVLTNNVWNTLVSNLSVDVPSIAADEEQILVIPNPVHHQAEIRFGKSFANIESQFRIFDAMGRLVDNRTVNASSIQIARGNLQTGIYFLELKNNISRTTGRFVID